MQFVKNKRASSGSIDAPMCLTGEAAAKARAALESGTSSNARRGLEARDLAAEHVKPERVIDDEREVVELKRLRDEEQVLAASRERLRSTQ